MGSIAYLKKENVEQARIKLRRAIKMSTDEALTELLEEILEHISEE